MSLELSPNLNPYDKDDGQAGILAPSGRGWTTATAGMTAQSLYLARVVPSRAMSITLAVFGVGVADTADNSVEVALFNGALTSRLATSGLTAGKLNAGTGPKSVALAYALEPGTVYYVGLLVPTITTSLSLGFANFGSVNYAQMFTGAAPYASTLTKAAQASMPSSVASPAAIAAVPVIALRES